MKTHAIVTLILAAPLVAQAPANDECSGAQLLSAGVPFAGDSSMATSNATDPALPCIGNAGGASVWFQFVAPQTSVAVSASSTARMHLQGYSGACGSLLRIGCADGPILPRFNTTLSLDGLTPGNTYFVSLSTNFLASGSAYQIELTLPGPGETCALAVPAGALPAAVFPPAGTGPYWVAVTGTGTTLTATACEAGTASAQELDVFCGDCGTLVTVAEGSPDAACPGEGKEAVTWCTEPGVTYLLRVSNAGGGVEVSIADSGVGCVPAFTCSPAELVVVDDDGGMGVDYMSLQDALALVPSGATVLVREGDYGGIDVRRAVSIVADPSMPGGSVEISRATFQELEADAIAHVRGLTAISDGLFPVIDVHDNAGTVWLEECDVTALSINGKFGPGNALGIARSQDVVARGCTFQLGPAIFSGGSGIGVDTSSLHLYDSQVTGGEASMFILPAVDLTNAFLFAVDSSITGGAAGIFGGSGGTGLRVRSNSVAFLRNVAVAGGSGPTPGQATFVEPLGTLTEVPGTVQSLDTPSPVRAGNMTQVTFQGRPNEFIAAYYALGPSPAFLAPIASALELNPPAFVFANVVLDAGGSASFPITTPSMPPGLLFTQLYLQGIHFDPTAAPAEQIRLGSPATVTLIDPSF